MMQIMHEMSSRFLSAVANGLTITPSQLTTSSVLVNSVNLVLVHNGQDGGCWTLRDGRSEEDILASDRQLSA